MPKKMTPGEALAELLKAKENGDSDETAKAQESFDNANADWARKTSKELGAYVSFGGQTFKNGKKVKTD